MNNFILKGNICYTKSIDKFEIYENHYLICKDNISLGIFEDIPNEYKDFIFYDYTDKLIMPGMVDLHLHASQYNFMGMCMDLELIDWLNNYTFIEEEKFKDILYAKKAYNVFVNDLKYSATTRASIFATIHKESTEILMDLLESSGLITYVGKVNMDREAPKGLLEGSYLKAKEDTFNWIKSTCNKYKNTFPILTPRFIISCSDQLMLELSKIQKEFNIPVQSHLSESLKEIDYVKQLKSNNKFYAQAYDEYDLFGKNNLNNLKYKTIMAHCVWSNDEEINLIKENEVYVAHCPLSNMNLSSGIAPMRKYIDKNINMGLATDIAAGSSISIFNAVVDAIKVSKLYSALIDSNAKPIKFSEAFYLATKGGGSFFGNVGSFEKGYEFDAIVIDDSNYIKSGNYSIIDRLERSFYMSLDEKCLIAKFVKGKAIFK